MAMSVSAAFALHNGTTRLQSGSKCWTEKLMSSRPERPQWTALV